MADKEIKMYPWRIESAKIQIHVEFDSSVLTKDFKTVQELADYLKLYPQVAEKVGYKVKK